jgi:hypothetical protein
METKCFQVSSNGSNTPASDDAIVKFYILLALLNAGIPSAAAVAYTFSCPNRLDYCLAQRLCRNEAKSLLIECQTGNTTLPFDRAYTTARVKYNVRVACIAEYPRRARCGNKAHLPGHV